MSGIVSTAHRRWRALALAPSLLAAALAAGLTFGATVALAQSPSEDEPAGADDLRARGLMTQALLAQGNLDRAREIATEGVKKFPDDAYALVILARVHLAFAEFNEAGQTLYQAVKLEPRLAVAHLELGQLYEAERRMASAKRHYKIAYELSPNEPSAMLAWARTVVDPMERLALLEKYLTLDERTDIARRAIENQVELIRRVGDTGHCRLRGDPAPTTLKIQEIRSQPGAANRYALKLNVNGAGEVRTLVDTGASGVIVTESIARAAKLERLGPNLLLGLGDQGVREGWFARAATLSAQGLVYEDCVVEVIPDEVRENMTTPALMGLGGIL